MEKIGFGVIGLGIWGGTHVKTYTDHPLVDLVKVCDLQEDRAKEIAEEHGVASYCSDYQEVLADDSIKAVSIVTPDFAHTPIAIAAAEAGKDILLEKPMATSVEDCEAINAAVEKAGVKLMLDFHNRFDPPIHRVKESLEDGDMGELQMMTLRLNDTIEVPTEWLGWASKSTVLWFLASHCIDLVRWLFDDEVDQVYTVSRSKVLKARGVDTPDFYHSIVEMKKGGVIALENCWIVAANAPIIFDFKIEAVGSEGTCYVDVSHHRAVERYTKKDTGYADVFCMPTVQGKPTGFAVESIRYFIDCVVEGKAPFITGKDGIAATKVICAMEESVSTGAPVKVG